MFCHLFFTSQFFLHVVELKVFDYRLQKLVPLASGWTQSSSSKLGHSTLFRFMVSRKTATKARKPKSKETNRKTQQTKLQLKTNATL